MHTMKNPLKKEDYTGLIVGIAIGATAGIGLGYLFLTKKGGTFRKQMAEKFKDTVSDKAANLIAKKTIVPKKAAKVATDAALK
jgi:gas vesicle protein